MKHVTETDLKNYFADNRIRTPSKPIPTDQRTAIYSRAFALMGEENRQDKFIEEAGEFLQAIMKARYNPSTNNILHYIEELCDVSILVDILKQIIREKGQGWTLEELEKAKLQKLQKKLEEGEKS